MLQNYQYFITLAETLNISHAAQKLYISHQCLSRYLKTLEHECGLTLFERKPTFALTYAGQTLLEAFREIERIEKTPNSRLKSCAPATAARSTSASPRDGSASSSPTF